MKQCLKIAWVCLYVLMFVSNGLMQYTRIDLKKRFPIKNVLKLNYKNRSSGLCYICFNVTINIWPIIKQIPWYIFVSFKMFLTRKAISVINKWLWYVFDALFIDPEMDQGASWMALIVAPVFMKFEIGPEDFRKFFTPHGERNLIQ